MGIQIQGAAVKPSIVYDKIHLTRLEIVQPTFANDSLQPIYNLSVSYRHYGNVDGIRYYQDEDLLSIEVKDYIALAMTKAGTGDMSLITALQAIETVVASLIAAETGGVATVV